MAAWLQSDLKPYPPAPGKGKDPVPGLNLGEDEGAKDTAIGGLDLKDEPPPRRTGVVDPSDVRISP